MNLQPLPTRCGSLVTTTRLENPLDKAQQTNPSNVKLALRALHELQSNPQPTNPGQTHYPLSLTEYRYLLDVLPDLRDLRRIWGYYRIEYLYFAQQLVIMPSAGRRHNAAVNETVRWIMRPSDELIYAYDKNIDTLSEKDRKTREWYKLLVDFGTSEVTLPESHHSPDALLGSRTEAISPLVIEVADSQRSQDLLCLADDYLNFGKGLIKYMFAVDIRETAGGGADVDLIIWKYIKVGESGHSNEQWSMHPLIRAEGTEIDTSPTISYPLSDILGEPPEGCDDVKIVLQISDLIENITSILPTKQFDKDVEGILQSTPGRSLTPRHRKNQEAEIKLFQDFDSGAEDDSETEDKSFRPSLRPSSTSPPASGPNIAPRRSPRIKNNARDLALD